MAELYTNLQYFDFSGAVNQSASRLLMADNELNNITNGEYTQVGNIYKVRGYTKRGATVNPNYTILGMVNAIKASDGTQKQIVIANGATKSDAYTYNPTNGLWTPHGLSLSTGAQAEFESFLNGFYMVNFDDATRFNDINQWYTTTNVTSAARAKYIKLYLSQIYLAYVVTGGSTHPSRVTYSDLPNGSPLQTTWNDSLNYFDVDTDNGDVIMGLETNASVLLIFKKNSLYYYDTNQLYQIPGAQGTVSNRTIKNIQGHTLYLHNTGIWDYAGGQATLISRKIQDLIDGISNKSLSTASAFVKRDHYYLYVGDVFNTRTGLTVNKCLIDYNIAFQSFSWRSLQDTPVDWMSYPDDTSNITYNESTLTYDDANTTYNATSSPEDRIFFGTDSGEVFQFDTGNTMDGAAIPFIIETKDYYLSYPAYWKLLQKVVLFTSYSGKGLVLQAKLDDNDWITLRDSDKEPGVYIFPNGSRCQRVRFRLLESGTGGQYAFEGLDIYFTATGLIR